MVSVVTGGSNRENNVLQVCLGWEIVHECESVCQPNICRYNTFQLEQRISHAVRTIFTAQPPHGENNHLRSISILDANLFLNWFDMTGCIHALSFLNPIVMSIPKRDAACYRHLPHRVTRHLAYYEGCSRAQQIRLVPELFL